MSGQPTRAGWAGRAPAEWRGFAQFLRNPVLPDRATLSLAGSARALGPLFALDMLLMAAVLGGIGIATALGLKLPEHMLNELTLTPLLIGFIVIGAPIGEEALFRGWLSGRPGHILAVLALLAGAATLMVASHPLIKAAGLGAGLVIAAGALFGLRGRGALPWFQRHFRWFYYASALLFAGVHLTNFAGTGGPSAGQLPLVLPQLVLGLILGYLRVNRGLMTGAALHMMHNALFAALMLLGAS
jgi:membrane protease YdiL (CAAX protease family)